MVSFYTRERGLVEAAARGIGKPGSSLAAVVEPFALSKLFLAEGKGADRLTQAEPIESFYELRRDMTRYACAAAACELILRTTEPGQVVPGLFDTLVPYLRAMEATQRPQLLSWAFELAYLQMSGLAPVLDRCVICEAEIVGGTYIPAHGGLVCGDCSPDAGVGRQISPGAARTIVTMRRFQLDRLDRLGMPDDYAAQIAGLLRDHIRYHLDVSLKADGFVESLGRWRRPPGGTESTKEP